MNSKKKEIIKVFIFLFLFSYIIINWNNVSWVFNYREMSGLIYDFFNPYQDNNILVNAENQVQVEVNNKIYSLSIPNIGLLTPVVIGESKDKTILAKDLDKGAVYYPGSVLPGENGQIIILGHSAPPNWPHIKHDWVFSNIENLNFVDEIILNFKNIEYNYIVKDKRIIQQGQDVAFIELSKTNNVLTLISCWPPGKNYQRIAITAELKN